jgi:hypothetical protein
LVFSEAPILTPALREKCQLKQLATFYLCDVALTPMPSGTILDVLLLLIFCHRGAVQGRPKQINPN